LNRRINQLRLYLLSLLPVVLIISFLGAWIVAYRSLSPFSCLLNNLHHVRSASIDHRLPVGNNQDELDQLALAVNSMLDELGQAFSQIREFTGDAAHELRTPLARLTTLLEHAISKSLSQDQALATLDEAYQECMRLRRLVDDLMLMARLDSENREETVHTVDLSVILEDLKELWQEASTERGIQVHIESPPQLLVQGRSVLLRRLLTNLVDNALQQTQREGRINVQGTMVNSEIKLVVSDNGPGIDAEHTQQLFNRFYRIQPDRRRGVGGTGLGLSICQKIVQLHGGHIQLESHPGQGTVSEVYLPALKDNEA
jgi:two-component system, OmpR family, heavy metal sensor histidine kinase CusS